MIANIRALVEACDALGITYRFVDKHQNVVEVISPKDGKAYSFVKAATPFNDSGTAALHADKEYTHELLRDVIRMPKTFGYLDPNIEGRFQQYLIFKTHAEIAQDAEQRISEPYVVKRTMGYGGNNLFLVSNPEEAEQAFSKVFDHHSKDYDAVALAQEFIHTQNEYRVIILNNKVEIIYERAIHRDIQKAFDHYVQPEAIMSIQGSEVFKAIEAFLEPLFEKCQLGFAGLDVALNTEGEYCLFEINTRPGFSDEYFVGKNGIEPLVELYKKGIEIYL